MKFCLSGRVLTVLLLLALAGSVDAQSFRWWTSDHFKKGLGLTAEQCARIDEVFQTALPQLRQSYGELGHQEAELSRLIEADADETQVVQQVDRIERTRGSLNKMRTLMLLRMRHVLSPEQRAKFKALQGQWERDHRRDGDTPSKPRP
jgi:Spy/CpxP family protein refolding chaperone